MKGPGSKPGLLFQLVVPATAVFIITILSLIAVLFSDERAPLAQWLNRNGNTLLLAELVAVIALSILAMAVDRWKTLRSLAAARPAKSSHEFADGKNGEASSSATNSGNVHPES